MTLPSAARTPMPASPVSVMIVRTPCTSATMAEAYPASSLSSFATHTVLPVILSSATIPALEPPGVTITWSPSTSGDSLSSQLMLRPPKSFRMLRCHTAAPSCTFRHARSPFSVRT